MLFISNQVIPFDNKGQLKEAFNIRYSSLNLQQFWKDKNMIIDMAASFKDFCA